MILKAVALSAAVAMLAVPALAEESADAGFFVWSAAEVDTVAPVPHTRTIRVAASPKIANDAPVIQPASQPAFRLDRFWVIGSFR